MHLIEDITRFIFVSHPPEQADCIMIPGSARPECPEVAACLWKQGHAPLIIPSGRFSIKSGRFEGAKVRHEVYPGPYDTESAFMKAVLCLNGVPPDAVLEEPMATYTMENAILTRKLAEDRGYHFQKILLVCKAFHARRALMYYQSAFPCADFRVVPVSIDGVSADTWYQSDTGIAQVMGEIQRIGLQMPDVIRKFRQEEQV